MSANTQSVSSRRSVFLEGVHDGIPIALGYLVVSFTLGIAARNAGLSPLQGFFTSLFNNASAGEYAAFTVIAGDAPYLELAIITLIANARYMLMSCVISQKFAANTSLWQRIAVGFGLTDEIFGITISRPGKLNPYYNYGAMTVALSCWALGTAIGIIAGNLLPLPTVSALSVALFGMFLWIIIPSARDNNIIRLLVVISFILSFAFANLPYIMELSAGTRTIILTIIIAGAGAILCPVDEDIDHES